MSVDFKFQETRVLLGLKTLDFFRRHRALARLTESLVEERDPPLERLLSLFQWTVDRIAPQPEGKPVLDDHILAIIERGYGIKEQSADVFTTLSVYAGFPAAMVLVGPPGFQEITLSLVQVGEDYFLFDTERRNYFPGPDGRPASLRAFQKDPRLAQKAPYQPLIEGIKYSAYFEGLGEFSGFDRTLRGDLQIPWRRLLYEVERAFGLAPEAVLFYRLPARPLDSGKGSG